jgi:hypothetical protein
MWHGDFPNMTEMIERRWRYGDWECVPVAWRGTDCWGWMRDSRVWRRLNCAECFFNAHSLSYTEFRRRFSEERIPLPPRETPGYVRRWPLARPANGKWRLPLTMRETHRRE